MNKKLYHVEYWSVSYAYDYENPRLEVYSVEDETEQFWIVKPRSSSRQYAERKESESFQERPTDAWRRFIDAQNEKIEQLKTELEMYNKGIRFAKKQIEKDQTK